MITFSSVSSRIGKWKAEILTIAKYAQTLQVTQPMMKDMPKNNSKTMVFRRWLPYGGVDNRFITAATSDAATAFANAHLLAEGVTPSSDTIAPTDVTVILAEYGMLYSFTNQTYDFHEDDIPAAITQQLGERKGALDEQIDYAALQACTSKLYAGGGATRVSVDKALTLAGLRVIAQQLYANSAAVMTAGGTTGSGYGSAPTEAGWIVVTHSDSLADVRGLDGYIKKEEYSGGTRPVHPMEKGSVEEFRFVASPHLQPILNAGAAVGTTGLKATSANVDVYQSVVMAKEAWGKMSLMNAGSITPKIHMPDSADKADPLGQRGYHGMRFYAASKVLNDGWMYIYEHGVTDLSSSY
jgi:N4-gp56 family major capsid protein